jgi:hypothetical protein
VDIVLDRRNKILGREIKEVLPKGKSNKNIYEYNGFVFEVMKRRHNQEVSIHGERKEKSRKT